MNFRYQGVRLLGYLLASLPLRLLYGLAAITAFVFNHIAAYRKDVILQNLRRAFPEKQEEEIRTISARFYKIFLETMFETLKLLRMDPGYLPGRIQVQNPEILEKHYREGRSVIAVAGHYGNWEWLGTALKALVPFRVIAVYKPLTDAAIDKLMLQVRSINGSELIPMKKAFREIQASETPTLSYLIADQAPNPENAYWTRFLNQDTPVFLGPERIARLTGSAVVFFRMQRTGMGKYRLEIEELCADARTEPENEVTIKHVKALENQILEDPAPWLWSHRRWKHKRN